MTPPDFTRADPGAVDVWVPLRTAGRDLYGDDWSEPRGSYAYGVLGRLRRDVTPNHADEEATAVLVAAAHNDIRWIRAPT